MTPCPPLKWSDQSLSGIKYWEGNEPGFFDNSALGSINGTWYVHFDRAKNRWRVYAIVTGKDYDHPGAWAKTAEQGKAIADAMHEEQWAEQQAHKFAAGLTS